MPRTRGMRARPCLRLNIHLYACRCSSQISLINLISFQYQSGSRRRWPGRAEFPPTFCFSVVCYIKGDRQCSVSYFVLPSVLFNASNRLFPVCLPLQSAPNARVHSPVCGGRSIKNMQDLKSFQSCPTEPLYRDQASRHSDELEQHANALSGEFDG